MINKKGQAIAFLPYLLVGIVVLFIFAMVAVPMASVTDDVLDELQEPDAFGDSERGNASMTQVKGLVTPALDQLIFIILIGLILGLILIAIFSDFNPVLITVVIIAIVLFVIIAGLLSTAFVDFTGNDEFVNKSAEFTLTNVVIGPQLPIIILIAGAIMLIILFAKRGRVISPV